MIAALILSAMFAATDLRTWTDASGKFHVEARFVRIDGDNAILQPVEGREVSVPLARLSEIDRVYLEAKKTKAAPPAPGQERSAPQRIPYSANVSRFIDEEQTRLQAERPVGDPTSVSLFGGQPSQGRTFAFLIDRSKSMARVGHSALEVAETEILTALGQLQRHHKFQVIAYNDECKYLNERQLLPATPENKQAVEGFLHRLAMVGKTEHGMALQSALLHNPDVIYLLTDGGAPEMTEAQLRKVNVLAGKTSIHCIQVGLGPRASGDNFLARLASMNRGSFQYVDLTKKN